MRKKQVKNPMILIGLVTAAAFLWLLKDVSAENINLGVEVTEIMYDSPVNDSGGEWLEFRNGTGHALDIDGFLLTVGEESEVLSQREGWGDIHQIPAGSYVVITEPGGTVNFDELYPELPKTNFVAVTKTAISMSNSGGERIMLQNVDGVIFQDFVYPDNAKNAPIIKVSLDADETFETSWIQSSNPFGTPCMPEDDSLPVSFSSITAVHSKGGVRIQWTTQTEVNNLGFNILRSQSPEGPFLKITSKMIKGAGSSAVPNRYTFIDSDGYSKFFYRIESIDLFGQKELSEVVSTIKRKRQLTKWSILKNS